MFQIFGYITLSSVSKEMHLVSTIHDQINAQPSINIRIDYIQ